MKTEKTNEERIFDSIQELKDSLFGMKLSYVRYCYSKSESGLYWDNQKSERFIQELLNCSKESRCYDETFDDLIMTVFELSLKFILHASNFDEQRFVNLRKIIKTTEKFNISDKSVFEIMVDTQKKYFDLVFLRKCDDFSKKIASIEFDKFYRCCKHGIELFIDNKKLNTILNDDLSMQMVSRINRLANITAMEVRRNAEVNGVFDYE